MEYTLSATCRLVVAYLITVWCGFGVRGLHELDISVPGAVLLGESVVLECTWRLEDEEALYSVKWYRGRDEFYRYIPKELPHTRVFPQPGIEVDISRSGARRVVLQHATPEMAGRFRCEVSADAPTFHTEIRSAHLDVVEPPPGPPQLTSDRSWYDAGSVLRASCAVPPAYPPANITWMLNGIEIEGDPLTHALPSWFEWEPTARPATSAPGTTPAPRDELEFAAFGAAGGADADADAPPQYLDAEYVERHRDQIRRPKQSILRPFERTGPDNRRVSFSEASFAVTSASFERGVLRLTCVATIYNLHAARAELAFDMEQPEVASVLGVRNRAVGVWRCAATSVVLAINSLLVASYR